MSTRGYETCADRSRITRNVEDAWSRGEWNRLAQVIDEARYPTWDADRIGRVLGIPTDTIEKLAARGREDERKWQAARRARRPV